MGNRKLNVDIKISGTTGSGKSTVSFLIKKALEQYGLQVNFTDQDVYPNEKFMETYGLDFEKRIAAINSKSDISVNITQVQLKRDLTES